MDFTAELYSVQVFGCIYYYNHLLLSIKLYEWDVYLLPHLLRSDEHYMVSTTSWILN